MYHQPLLRVLPTSRNKASDSFKADADIGLFQSRERFDVAVTQGAWPGVPTRSRALDYSQSARRRPLTFPFPLKASRVPPVLGIFSSTPCHSHLSRAKWRTIENHNQLAGTAHCSVFFMMRHSMRLRHLTRQKPQMLRQMHKQPLAAAAHVATPCKTPLSLTIPRAKLSAKS